MFFFATSVNFEKTAESKPSPIGRKFAQSGHPGHCNDFTQILPNLSFYSISIFRRKVKNGPKLS
jgi:hypothetical protein